MERYTESDKSEDGQDEEQQLKYQKMGGMLGDGQFDILKHSLKNIQRMEQSLIQKKQIQKEVDNQIDSSSCKPV